MGNASILISITDGLIFWSLEATDPEKRILFSRDEILAKIEGAIPTARKFIRGKIDERLKLLRSKGNPQGRQISWYAKEDAYALRYEQRMLLIEDDLDDTALFNAITDRIRERIKAIIDVSLYKLSAEIARVISSCIDAMFEKQGFTIGLYFIDKNDEMIDSINLIDDIDAGVDRLGLKPADRQAVHDVVVTILRKLIYNPDDIERKYFIKLSTTYFLLFALKSEPRIVEYFNSMANRLVLYIGSDLIIKALSEHNLPVEGRMVTNALDVIKSSGADLIVTEPALEEVFTHLHASTLEFENFYANVENMIDEDFVYSIDRILIRSYFYAKLNINTIGRPPQAWRSYISQFCNYDDVRRKQNSDSLRFFICDKFGLGYESKEEMLKSIDRDELAKLTAAIVAERSKRYIEHPRRDVLAYNDALHVLRVYSRRLTTRDNIAPNPFGHKTWWVTHEQAVQRASLASLGPYKPRVIMRPEFLLNYIALMPTKREVVESYRTIFPTILGVSLGRRATGPMLHSVLSAARQAASVDNSRAKAMLNEFSDKLKTDQLRVYESRVEMPH